MMRGPASRALACYNEATDMASASRRAPSTPRRSTRQTGRVVRVGLTQMACGPDPKANLARQLALAGQAAAKGAADRLHAGAVSRRQYFCQTEDHRFFALAETIPGPSTDCLPGAGEEARRGRRRVAVREARGGAVPQHRRHHRRRRGAAGHLSQDAHPRRPALLREVLLHARRHRLPRLEDEERHHRRARSAGTSGFPRARGSPRCRARRSSSTPPPSAGTRARRRSTAVPSTTRGSSSSAATPWPTGAGCACPTGRPRAGARCQGPPGERRRPRVLGPVVRGRARRLGRDARQHQPRRGAGGAVRPRARGVRPHALALPARSPRSMPTATSAGASSTLPPGAGRRGDGRPRRRRLRAPRVLAGTPGRARLLRFPPNGGAMRPRGSAGRGPKASRSRASTTRASRTSSGVIARHRRARARPPQRPERQLRAHRPARSSRARGVPAPARPLPSHPDQRMLDARSRPRLRAAAPARPHRDRRRRLGLQRLGRQVPAVDADDAVPTARGARAGPAGVPRRAS